MMNVASADIDAMGFHWHIGMSLAYISCNLTDCVQARLLHFKLSCMSYLSCATHSSTLQIANKQCGLYKRHVCFARTVAQRHGKLFGT